MLAPAVLATGSAEATTTYTLTVSISGMGTVTSTDGVVNCSSTCMYSYQSGTQVTLNAAPAAGWAFSDWSGACTGTGSCMVTMSQNQTVDATFIEVEYTLTVFTSGNGTVTSTDGFINCPGMCSHSYQENTQVTLNATPGTGYTFSGWSGACSGVGSCLVLMTQDLSVGATFVPFTYTLMVSTNGNGTVTSTDGFINCTNNTGTCSYSYPPNTQVTLNATAMTGWTFSGWSPAPPNGPCMGTGQCVVTMTQNQSVTATFTQNGYTLTVSISGNGTVTSTDHFINCPGTCSHTYPPASPPTQVTLTETAASGWTFTSWSTPPCTVNSQGQCVVTMNQNQSVVATFTQTTFTYTLTVSITPSSSGAVTSTDGFISCPGVCSYSYPANTQVTLNATPAAGWTFSGWSGARCSGTGSCMVTMTQNLSVAATFTQLPPNTLAVSISGDGTVTSNPSGINCPPITCSATYPYNTQVTLTAAPTTGWTFYGWSGACFGTGPCVVTMIQSLSVTATFTQNPITYSLTVAASGNGTVTSADGYINCPGTCSHSYSPNTPVTLTATPAAGWTFTGWNGACSGTGSCFVTMTTNLSVGATFTPLSYTLTVSTIGSGTVTSTDGFINCPGTCSHTYSPNTPVTLNTTPAEGWIFFGWNGACSGSGSCGVTMTQNLSVGATFSQLNYILMVSTSGNGSVASTDGFISCPGTCIHSYPSNTQVTLNATPAMGWAFSDWSGACSGSGACVATMTQTLSVGAAFTENPTQLVTITPCRVVDTRNLDGEFGGPPITGNTYRSFPIPQNTTCNIPSSAAAYSLNVTVVPHGPLGYLTIWPTGEIQPVVSTMNSVDGRVKANAAIVPAGASGAVSVYVTQTSDVILDIDGYFTQPGSGTYQFYPLMPCRVVDTRNSMEPSGLGPPSLGNMESRDLPMLTSPCLQNLPQQPQAYSLNVTVVPNPGGQPLDYLTVWPSDQNQPVVSTLNNPTATVVANAAIVQAAADGDIDVFAYNSTDLVIDINGYFAAPGQNGLSFYPATPCRAYDSRLNHGRPFQGEEAVNIVDSACAPPSSAQAYVLNATAVPNGFLGYLTLWPDSENQPVVSTLNAYDGLITSNMAIVPNINGSLDAYASQLTQLILDISGYFAP
jgi:uncharacterized repeat protein (TIGR02543 family)